jgi:hypothetical protein
MRSRSYKQESSIKAELENPYLTCQEGQTMSQDKFHIKITPGPLGVSFESFRSAIEAHINGLNDIYEQLGGQQRIPWRITGLRNPSPFVIEISREADIVVADKWREGVQAVCEDSRIPDYFTQESLRNLKTISDLSSDEISNIEISGNDNIVTELNGNLRAAVQELWPKNDMESLSEVRSLGSIRGYLNGYTDHYIPKARQAVFFITSFDQAGIRCYFIPEDMEKVKKLCPTEKDAEVLVEVFGPINRGKNGRIKSVQVDYFNVIEDRDIPTVEQVAHIDITGGRDTFDYLRKVHEDE